eukprot:CAMPEP_0185281204 /NCGR_PEP_ID=MMETSP1359-20130426/66589_1 /TAXON_ID=552665 /ORGANISM="Bigelowiella longifila, Strain CCMP242" /LENGTH=202 /DNA_ID=CAMNT_0027876613 /DNA_START=414 /DNA_END=1025 /DNA_ORIENTATION=+
MILYSDNLPLGRRVLSYDAALCTDIVAVDEAVGGALECQVHILHVAPRLHQNAMLSILPSQRLAGGSAPPPVLVPANGAEADAGTFDVPAGGAAMLVVAALAVAEEKHVERSMTGKRATGSPSPPPELWLYGLQFLFQRMAMTDDDDAAANKNERTNNHTSQEILRKREEMAQPRYSFKRATGSPSPPPELWLYGLQFRRSC